MCEVGGAPTSPLSSFPTQSDHILDVEGVYGS